METIKSWPQEKQDQFWELGYQCGDDLFHGFPSDGTPPHFRFV
jgi:hypothetical protein